MRARVPQDVDLEDKLIYGLTPVRFGYLVIAGLGAATAWNLTGVPGLLRLAPCVLLAATGVLLAWGRWRGRALDRFLADAALFVRRNYRVFVWPRRRRMRPTVPLALGSINALVSPALDDHRDG